MASGKMGSLDDIKRIIDGHLVERWYTVVVSLFYKFLNISAQQYFEFWE